MKVDVVNWKKEKVSNLSLPKDLFAQELNPYLINEVVRWQRACARQGTHKAKTRADVRGGGKKPFRQKGTGNARQGSIRSPLNRGGGVTFGPQPRKYKYALPANMKKAALKQTLSWLLKEKKVFFLEDMKSQEGKTKELSLRLKNFGVKKALLVDQNIDPLFKRACANLKFFQALPVEGLNVYDLLKYGQLMMSKESVSFLVEKHKEKQKDNRNNVTVANAEMTSLKGRV